jgi:hypothetical protein
MIDGLTGRRLISQRRKPTYTGRWTNKRDAGRAALVVARRDSAAKGDRLISPDERQQQQVKNNRERDRATRRSQRRL